MNGPAQPRATDPQNAARLMRLSTVASVTVASILIVIKLFAWITTDSVAMLSSLIDSVLDAAASLITMMAICHATTPADLEHRFGHGKAEGLASLFQVAVVMGSGVFLLFEAASHLLAPNPIANGLTGIIVMLASIMLTLALVMIQRVAVERTGSIAIAGDRLHYLSDLMSNTGVLAALGISMLTGWLFVDGLAGLIIAGYMIYSAWTIAQGALDMLMDRELPDEDRQRIYDIALHLPDVLAIHDLRTRRSGLAVFIQLHLELDGGMTLNQVHKISDQVEAEITIAFPGAEIIIHEDPAGVIEARADFQRHN